MFPTPGKLTCTSIITFHIMVLRLCLCYYTSMIKSWWFQPTSWLAWFLIFFFFYKHGYSRAQRAKAVKLCREGGDLLKTEHTGGVIFLSFGKDPTHYSMWIHTPLQGRQGIQTRSTRQSYIAGTGRSWGQPWKEINHVIPWLRSPDLTDSFLSWGLPFQQFNSVNYQVAF